MTQATATASLGDAYPLRLVRSAAIAFAVVAGGVVYFEPSLYEFVAGLALVVCFGTGLRLHVRLAPLVFLLAAYIAFGIPAALQTRPVGDGVIWMAISAFLAATSVLYAAFVAEAPDRGFRLVGWAYVVGTVVPSVAAMVGYFGIAGGDLFLLYGRARGTFEDPNVLGPFLVLPILFLADGALRGTLKGAIVRGALMLPLVFVMLLTFSRGGWLHFALSAAMLGTMTYFLTTSVIARLRILVVAALGAAAIGVVVAAALSVPKVESLFEERAQLTQSYDTGRDGRVGRWQRGFALALEEPTGIGPLEFGKRFSEDPHNVYLNALMSFGWGGFFAYVTLIGLTIVLGFRAALAPTPWRGHTLVALSTFVPLAVLGGIIDTDHWRHFFLVLGTLWGLIAATGPARRALSGRPAGAPPGGKG